MTRKRGRRALAVAVVVAVLAATALAVAPSTAQERARSAAVTVRVGDNFFSRNVSIRRRGVVRWVWVGEDFHNVRGGGARSRTQRRGSYSYRFRRVGRFRIICTLHPNEMRMIVRVRR